MTRHPFPSLTTICIILTLLSLLPGAVAEAEDVAYLYWATANTGEVYRSLADGGIREQIVSPLTIDALALDVASSQMYYGGSSESIFAGALMRSDLDGTGQSQLVAAGNVRGIALDLPGGKVYWAERTSQQDRIFRANLDGSNLELLVASTNFDSAIALDLVASRMYWAAPPDGIYRANLDGTGATQVDPLNNVRDLAVDAANSAVWVAADTGLQVCDLDVANCSTLVVDAVKGIELAGSTAYYQLNSDGSIWSMDLDGQNQQQVSFGLHKTIEFALDAVNSHFYFPDKSIFRADLDGSNQMPLVGGAGGNVHDVAVDGAGERYFVSDASLDTLVTGSIEDLDLTSLFPGDEAGDDLYSIRGIVLDAANETLFAATWEDASGGEIWRIDLAGPSRTAIASGLTNAHDVAYDPVDDKVYWNTDLGDASDLTGRIQRSNPDGSNPEDVITGLPQKVRGLDVDAVNRKLYWTDMENGQIRRANLDGTVNEAVLTGLDTPHDVALDPAAGRMYWVEKIVDNDDPGAMIRAAGLDGSSPFDVRTGLSHRTRDLTVVVHRRLSLFEDGFESGTTAAWSSTVP